MPSLRELLTNALSTLSSLNYVEQFLEIFPDFLHQHLPVEKAVVFFLNKDGSEFKPFYPEGNPGTPLHPFTQQSNLVIYLKNYPKPLVLKQENAAKLKVLKKFNSDAFEEIQPDLIVPLLAYRRLYGFLMIKAKNRFFKEIEEYSAFFEFLAHMVVPKIAEERMQLESDRNYYKIYRMDRLALVGELAASAAHEIKNPLAGISTYLTYFMEKNDFKKADIYEELIIMKQSIGRIDHIVKSLLSFSRFGEMKITSTDLSDLIEATLKTVAFKIPRNVRVNNLSKEHLVIETDAERLRQVLINIIFNAADALGRTEGEITLRTFISGRDQLPSRERFNISIRDTGPGIPDEFKEKLFQPFQTTKADGTGLGLYTCYGLMKSLGGEIKIESSTAGTEVVLSMPAVYEEEGPVR